MDDHATKLLAASRFKLTYHMDNGKEIKWRRNGKNKTWKTRPNEFKIPVKHGLYDYGYITHENCALFSVDE